MIYLNVGGGKSIKEKADKQKRTETPSYEIPKSFVLYKDEEGEMKVCFSQFSSASLLGRVGKETQPKN